MIINERAEHVLLDNTLDTLLNVFDDVAYGTITSLPQTRFTISLIRLIGSLIILYRITAPYKIKL